MTGKHSQRKTNLSNRRRCQCGNSRKGNKPGDKGKSASKLVKGRGVMKKAPAAFEEQVDSDLRAKMKMITES